MYLLQAQNLTKTFGTRTLFRADQLELHDGDRVGLVGENGAGKSTLLDILRGDLPCDEGNIDRRCPIAMIRQSGDAEGEPDGRLLRTLSLAGSACKSGGERTRRAIAAACSQGAPLLFADEPTTNLDLDGIEAVERMLQDYSGAVLLISHDRQLLETVCTSIWAIQDGEIRVFPGGYAEWIAQRDRERAFAQFEYDRYRSEKRRLEAEMVNLREQARGMRKTPKRMGNSEARLHKCHISPAQIQVQARAKAIESRVRQLEVKERPSDLPQIRMALGAVSPITSRTAARIDHLTVRYGARAVLEDVSFTLPTGKRTFLLGGNGAGKTTLAEHLVQGGDCARLANGVQIGYFSQNHELLDPARTVLENVRAVSRLPEHEVRSILANLWINGDAVQKPVRVLSGGERAKVALARLLASDCNLLVLDEPTNHIDLYTAQALEPLLLRWQGTLLVISHDRHLIEQAAERLLFVENGRVRAFEGTMAEYREEQSRRNAPSDDLSGLIEQMRRAEEAFRAGTAGR